MDEWSSSWATQPEISQYVLLKPVIRKTTAWKLCKHPVFNLYVYFNTCFKGGEMKSRCSEALSHLFQVFSFNLSAAPVVMTLIFHHLAECELIGHHILKL